MMDIKGILESVNSVAVTGLKTGLVAGQREAEIKARPLVDALEAVIRAYFRGEDMAQTITAARDAITTYKGTATNVQRAQEVA